MAKKRLSQETILNALVILQNIEVLEDIFKSTKRIKWKDSKPYMGNGAQFCDIAHLIAGDDTTARAILRALYDQEYIAIDRYDGEEGVPITYNLTRKGCEFTK